MENMESVKDTLWAYMKDKRYLDEVDLTWDYGVITSGIFPNFQPHPNLEKLKIRNYPAKNFPDWVGDPSFFNLVSLEL